MISRGQMEDNISKAIIKFEKEYLGRGPREVKTYILDDIILVRLKGMLTPAEQLLAKTSEGTALLKQTRIQLIEKCNFLLEEIIFNITQKKVISMHIDISVKTGEKVFVFILEDAPCPAE